MLKNRYPLGVQYHRSPVPPADEWESDLAHIARLGLDHIYIWVMWCNVERKPGTYTWDELEGLMDRAAHHGLDVILNLELWGVPPWAERDEFRVVRPDGFPRPFQSSVIHSLYSGRPCLDNRELRKLLESFMRAAVATFKNKPNLLCWKVWNEPDVDNCACSTTRAKYGSWLRERFGSLESVSAFLGRSYTDWEEIKPPLAVGDTPANLLYTEFRFWSAREIAAWAVNVVRQADPNHIILTDTRSTGTARLDLLADRIWDDWQSAQVPDIFGGHLHSAVGSAHASAVEYAKPIVDLECKRSATRHSPRGYWLTEVPGGTGRALGGTYDMHENLLPGEMRLNLWTTLAHGARSISPWQFKPERIGPEAPGWGVVEMDGSPTYRTEELADFAHAVRGHETVFAEAQTPTAAYAVLFSPESSVAVSSLSPFTYADAMQGVVGMLWRENVHFDIVRGTADLNAYRVVYLPMPWLIPGEDLRALLAFARQGGIVCAEAGFASLDDNGWYAPRVPRLDLWQELGYRERDIFRNPTVHLTTSVGPLTGAGEWRPVRLDGAESIGTLPNTEEPGVISSSVGDGRFLYIGTYPSLYARDQHDRIGAATLMRLSGMVPAARVDAELPVTCRVLEHGTDRLLFVFNHARQSGTATVTPTFAYARAAVLYTDPASTLNAAGSSELQLTLAAKGVAVLRLTA